MLLRGRIMNKQIESGGLVDVGSAIKGFGEHNVENSDKCGMIFGVVLSTIADLSLKCLVRIRTYINITDFVVHILHSRPSLICFTLR